MRMHIQMYPAARQVPAPPAAAAPLAPPAPPVVANADLAPLAHRVDDEGWEIFEEAAYPFRPQ